MKKEQNQEQELPKERFSTNFIILIFIFSVTYSIVRYHIFGGVEWSQLPVFIMNKIMSMNGLILLTFTLSLKPLKNKGINISQKWLRGRKVIGVVGFVSILIHIILSALLFSPVYYNKFFNTDGTLTLNSGLSMIFGVLAFVMLWYYNLSFYNPQKDIEKNMVVRSRGFLLLIMPFVAIHLFFMGYKGWLNPAGWHGGIPPISLITFVIIIAGCFINVLGRK